MLFTFCALLARTVAARDASNNYQWLSKELEVPFLVYYEKYANDTQAPVHHSLTTGIVLTSI